MPPWRAAAPAAGRTRAGGGAGGRRDRDALAWSARPVAVGSRASSIFPGRSSSPR